MLESKEMKRKRQQWGKISTGIMEHPHESDRSLWGALCSNAVAMWMAEDANTDTGSTPCCAQRCPAVVMEWKKWKDTQGEWKLSSDRICEHAKIRLTQVTQFGRRKNVQFVRFNCQKLQLGFPQFAFHLYENQGSSALSLLKSNVRVNAMDVQVVSGTDPTLWSRSAKAPEKSDWVKSESGRVESYTCCFVVWKTGLYPPPNWAQIVKPIGLCVDLECTRVLLKSVQGRCARAALTPTLTPLSLRPVRCVDLLTNLKT